MGLGSKAWFALMRRNLLYRKRYWLSSIFEFVLPWIFLTLLVWLRSSVGEILQPTEVDAYLPQDYDIQTPLRFHDYLTALQAKRVCLPEDVEPLSVFSGSLADFFTECFPAFGDGLSADPAVLGNLTLDDLPDVLRLGNATESDINLINGLVPQLLKDCGYTLEPVVAEDTTFSISGMPVEWHVPLIKCDKQLCKSPYEDAEPYCERKIVGITGDEGRVEDFLTWIEAEYPVEKELRLFYVFKSSEDMDKYVENRLYGRTDANKTYHKLAMGIVFGKVENPSVWNYQLRPNSTNFNTVTEDEEFADPAARSTPETSRVTDSYARSESDACGLGDGNGASYAAKESCTAQYADNGVLTFQRLVHDFILNQTEATESVASVSYVPFPSKAYEESSFFNFIAGFLTLFVILGLLYPVASMVSYIVKEKQFRQKELLKMMSVTESDLEWSWFTTFFVFHIITGTVAAFLFSRVFVLAWLPLVWIFWVLTMTSSITFSMAIAAVTSKSVRAVLFAVLGFFCGFFLTFVQNFERGQRQWIQLISLHPVAAFSYGVDQVTKLEASGVGLSLSNVAFSDTRSGYSFADTLTMLVVDCIVWGLLTFYFNRVIRPDYGQALPIHFPLLPSYWFPSRVASAGVQVDAVAKNSDIPYEKVDAALERQSSENKTIEIHDIRKSFGDKIAVDGLSLSIYSGQITALLGHNGTFALGANFADSLTVNHTSIGAGKTTLISLLTGAVKPSSGYATLQGKDIRTDLGLIRKDIGICLQHDCLFPDLTVREHIQFFARLKGLYEEMPVSEANSLIDQSIRDVALFEKRNSRSKALSGGMKRKLSLCMAFCGGSKVVLLDEPTSGMDPFSRRFTWDGTYGRSHQDQLTTLFAVIRQYRENRCIILTTHFMDEADILGDRIAIMADGQLRCAGSPLYLKKAYGVGYQLTIEKSVDADLVDIDAEDQLVAKAESPYLVELVEKHIPETSVLSDVGTELKLQLPVGATPKFPPLLESLDREIEAKNAISYGVSMTTMDEVFLLVARGDQLRKATKLQSSRKLIQERPAEEGTRNTASRTELNNGSLFTAHVQALVKKRAANFKRDKKAWCCTTLMPSLFVLVGFLVYMRATGGRSLPSLELDIGDFNSKVEEGIINPISINPSTFTCLPTWCQIRGNFSVDVTDETYSYCLGVEPSFDSCSILSPSNVLGDLEGFKGISLVEVDDAVDVAASSGYLLDSSNDYSSTRYGALWITKDSSSTTDTEDTLDDILVARCYQQVDAGFQYVTYRDCDRLRGLGLLIQYNFTGLHTAPLFQALVDQALARSATNDPNLEIRATIAPLPITNAEKGFGSAQDSFLIWFLMILSFPFISGAYASFIVEERESKAKHLQTVAGVEPVAYWFSSFIWDVLNYQLPLWTTVAMMFVFNVDALITKENDVLYATLALLVLYGPAAAGYAYCTSFLFKSATLCNVVLIISSFVLSLGGTIAVFIMSIFIKLGAAGDKVELANVILTWILRLVPACNLAKGLLFVLNITIFTLLGGLPQNVSALSKDIVRDELIVLACQSLIYPILAIFLDIFTNNPRAMGFCFSWGSPPRSATDLNEDNDVVAEESRVLNGEASEDLIVMMKLSKVYRNGKVAVRNLSLGIPPGECFGLLGTNGAGKTSTMGILTAEFPPSGGDATLAGYSIVSEPQKIRRRVGYCPQFDAHFANMTGREHVTLYASVKGIPSAMVRRSVADKLQEVGLSDFDADRLCANYSGGMKRRLSIACATIGQPRIVFLDECSTGVDPVARREIWQLVSDMVSNGDVPKEERTSVILTTHSMEECEALCPRIGIMANGRLRCLGSAQHLKNKFGQGFQVEINAKEAEAGDSDFIAHSNVLARSKGLSVDGESGLCADNPSFALSEVITCLKRISDSDYLSRMISASNPQGHTIWKAASSPSGISMSDLAAFVTNELRMKNIGDFMSARFPKHVVRERQDLRIRYEVSNEKLRLSSIFTVIEDHREELGLADYGVSQTSLEQVFNFHAAEAEELKRGTDDR